MFTRVALTFDLYLLIYQTPWRDLLTFCLSFCSSNSLSLSSSLRRLMSKTSLPTPRSMSCLHNTSIKSRSCKEIYSFLRNFKPNSRHTRKVYKTYKSVSETCVASSIWLCFDRQQIESSLLSLCFTGEHIQHKCTHKYWNNLIGFICCVPLYHTKEILQR